MRMPIKVKKVSQLMTEQQQPQAMPEEAPQTPMGQEQQRPVNEFGAVVTHPMDGVTSYMVDIKSNIKLTMKFLESQLRALHNLEKTGSDEDFAEQLPDSSNTKWWERKKKASERIKQDVMTFLPLLPKESTMPLEEDTEQPLAEDISEKQKEQEIL